MKFERKTGNMSFNHANLNKDFTIIGSDSRETFTDGTYNDNRQKTFVNRSLKLCWSITGLTKFHDIDNIDIINNIINMSSSNIMEKLTIIEAIMSFQTKRHFKESKSDTYFDIFVCSNETNHNCVYVLDIKNGISTVSRKYYANYFVSSGVHLEVEDELNLKNIKNKYMAPKELDRIICLAMDASKEDDNTVGGNRYIALMDNEGNISTYINGKEAKF